MCNEFLSFVADHYIGFIVPYNKLYIRGLSWMQIELILLLFTNILMAWLTISRIATIKCYIWIHPLFGTDKNMIDWKFAALILVAYDVIKDQ